MAKVTTIAQAMLILQLQLNCTQWNPAKSG